MNGVLMPNGEQTSVEDAATLLLKNHEARIEELEKTSHTTIFKKITGSASASALFLGLVLTFVSLHDAFVTKPEADRISQLSQFNQAVNSAAKIRQELIKSQFQSTDPQFQLAMLSAATPQILNDISTARAMLRDLRNDDIGVPQLIILTSEAFTAGDLENAKVFAARAVAKTDATPYLHSQAKRYEGKLFFAVEDPVQGRQSFQVAISSLGDSAATLSSRAFILADLVLLEYSSGDCASAGSDLQSLLVMLNGIHDQSRQQIGGTVRVQLLQLQGQHCPAVQGLDALLAN